MITCSRCGKVVPGGLSNCQYCGMPVTNRNESGGGPGNAGSEQPELPAWLQSLRAGTQPTYSNGAPTNFSAGNLMEEGALPSWLQPGSADAGITPSGKQPALRPSSMPAPITDGVLLANGSMSARSLIDEQSLPSWMHEQAGAQQGIPAASLVQPDALPPWLRDAEPHMPASPASPASPATPAISNNWATPGSAQPSQQRQSAQPQPAQPMQPMQPMQSASPTQQVAQGFQGQMPQGQQAQPFSTSLPPQGLSAQDLIDPQSLPSWLSGQQAANGGASLAAASLLDMNALPPWLRESGQGQQGQRPTNVSGGAMMPPSSPVAQRPGQVSPQGQQYQQPEGQYYQQQQPSRQASSGNLAAASFIDMDALPDWLRASGDGQPGGMGQGQPGAASYPRQASFGVPARPENVRVPGRPRGNAGPQEESEVAANVFASMLGVASNAPYLPGQGGSGQQLQAGQIPSQPQQGAPQMGRAPMQGGPVASGAQEYAGQVGYAGQAGYAGYAGQGQPMPGYGPQGYQAYQPSGQLAQPGQQSGYPMGNQLGVSQPPPNGMPQGMQGQQGLQGQMGQQGQPMGQMGQQGQMAPPSQAKSSAKKRGFLDTIREWFSRS